MGDKRKLFAIMKDAIFPENYTCMFCNAELSVDSKYNLCDTCIEKVEFIGNKACVKCGALLIADSKVCSDCKKNKRVVDRNYSAVMYEKDLKARIHDFKYKNKRYLKTALGNILYDKYLEIVDEFKPDIIIPVPLHNARQKERGYNQTELLLEAFKTDLEKIYKNILVRVKDTPHQANLSREARIENIKGAFAVTDNSKVKGKRILIVDDVYTSGATIDECALVLLEAGAKEVRSLTLAHSHEESPLLEEF